MNQDCLSAHTFIKVLEEEKKKDKKEIPLDLKKKNTTKNTIDKRNFEMKKPCEERVSLTPRPIRIFLFIHKRRRKRKKKRVLTRGSHMNSGYYFLDNNTCGPSTQKQDRMSFFSNWSVD
uniref:Uncharacterized protein n=1 Tax=Lepeophtheirus salmonis TaxID=72036 RepID=A0A0K2U1N9_LEPSM